MTASSTRSSPGPALAGLVARLEERGHRARKAGTGWMVKCPAHDDGTASLSLTQGDRGAVAHCFAGCLTEDVVATVGLTMADLFDDERAAARPARGAKAKAFVVRHWQWETRDSDNVLVAVQHRDDWSDGRKPSRWWTQPDGTLGLGQRKAETLPLYGTELLATYDPSQPLVLTEGQKACDGLRAAGRQAVATYGANVMPSDDVLAVLQGWRVVLWADNDAPGYRHMLAVAKALQGVAAGVSWVTWPGAPPKGDAADLLTQPDDAEAVAAALRRLRVGDVPDDDAPDDADSAPGSTRHDAGDATPKRRMSAADVLVALAEERYDLGRASDGEPYAVQRDGPNIALTFRGTHASLRAALASAYAAEVGKVPPSQSLTDVLAVLEGRALGAPRQPLPLRAYRAAPDHVLLDLGDDTGRVVSIRPTGWALLDRSPVTFRRSALTGRLPVPTAPDRDALAGLVNVVPEDVPLLWAHMVAALLCVPVPLLLLRGPAGTAKTSAAEILSRLIDASPAPTRATPRDIEAWAVAASGSFVVALDNVDTISHWLSDALCRAATGEALVRRALYTDSGLSVVAFMRAVILTAIDPGAMRGDLSDRLLAVDLRPIPDARRRDDAEVKAAFEAAHPGLLTAALQLTGAVLGRLPSLVLPGLPRMADFGRVLAAVDAELGTDGFGRYMAQRGELQREAAEGDPVGAAVLALLARQASWEGTASELLDALDDLRPERAGKEWPGTPRALAGALRRVEQPLAAAGVAVEFTRQGGSSPRRVVRLVTVVTVGRTPYLDTQPTPGAGPAVTVGVTVGDGRGAVGDGSRDGRDTPSRAQSDGGDGGDGLNPAKLFLVGDKKKGGTPGTATPPRASRLVGGPTVTTVTPSRPTVTPPAGGAVTPTAADYAEPTVSRPDGTTYCYWYISHRNEHRDVATGNPWCNVCTPQRGGAA